MVAAEVATGSGTSYDLSPSIAPHAGLAAGTGTAFNVGISGSETGFPAAGLGTGAAFNAGPKVSPSASGALGSGDVFRPSVAIEVNAGLPSGTGEAEPSVNVLPVNLEAIVSVGIKPVAFPTVLAHYSVTLEVLTKLYGEDTIEDDLYVEVSTRPKMLAEVTA
jgi:hypothetical protein